MSFVFRDSSGCDFGISDIERALRETGAHDCDTLFIHSDISFGQPVGAFRKREYLDDLYGIIDGLGVRNLIVPTFTYSFCNNEDYDIEKSKTSMGAFNEYVRKLGGRYRTDDPLLSVSVPDALKAAFSRSCENSLGRDSALDIIHGMGEVKFLFFGAEMAECFTYVHYVEKKLDVPYRFDMPFEGDVVYPDGRVIHRKQSIHTQCAGVRLLPKYSHFENEMEEKGYLRKKRIGDKYVACLSEKDAYREIKEHIGKDIYYFLSEPFSKEDLVHKYTYSTENGRITHC